MECGSDKKELNFVKCLPTSPSIYCDTACFNKATGIIPSTEWKLPVWTSKKRAQKPFKALYLSIITQSICYNHVQCLYELSFWIHVLMTCNFFFNWDSLQARLNSYYKAWSYKKKKHKKIKAYKKSVSEKPTVKRCLLIPDLKPFRP